MNIEQLAWWLLAIAEVELLGFEHYTSQALPYICIKHQLKLL